MINHIPHYIVLALISIIIVVSRLVFTFDQNLLIQALFIIAFIYVIWGIIHHWLDHDLTFKIMVEYILIAAIAMLAGIIAIKGGI